MIDLSDKYELPLAVADSIQELAKKVNVKPASIHQIISHSKKRGKRCRYIKVRVDEDE